MFRAVGASTPSNLVLHALLSCGEHHVDVAIDSHLNWNAIYDMYDIYGDIYISTIYIR